MGGGLVGGFPWDPPALPELLGFCHDAGTWG